MGLAKIATIAELAGEQRCVKEEAKMLSCYFERERQGREATRLEDVPEQVQKYAAMDAYFTVMAWHGLLLGLERRRGTGECARLLGTPDVAVAMAEARGAIEK